MGLCVVRNVIRSRVSGSTPSYLSHSADDPQWKILGVGRGEFDLCLSKPSPLSVVSVAFNAASSNYSILRRQGRADEGSSGSRTCISIWAEEHFVELDFSQVLSASP